MRTNDLHHTNPNHSKYFLKMTKTRAVTVLLMIVSTCGVILSLTDAYPTTNVTDADNLTETNPDRRNNTRLVITHLVRTIEFEVGVMEDDGVDDVDDIDIDNDANVTTTHYVETDVKILNVDLLNEILDKMKQGNMSSTTDEPEEEEKGKEEMTPLPSAGSKTLYN